MNKLHHVSIRLSALAIEHYNRSAALHNEAADLFEAGDSGAADIKSRQGDVEGEVADLYSAHASTARLRAVAFDTDPPLAATH